MSRRRRLLAVALAVGAAVAYTATSSAADEVDSFGGNVQFVQLSGFNETLVAVSSPSSATFRIAINERTEEITYRLSYSEFGTPVTQAHVHFGSAAQTGGVSFFLCTNLGNGPAGTQACPAAGPATVTGTIKPVDVIGPAAQGIAAGEFAEIVKAIKAGFAYVNVHTQQFAGGEVRAQLGHHH
ncbi:MAG TPA: CHRD domain-containing protein [Actinophytocola sp.]|jgi:hypothetical protein|uniref:CHRD domain-containing protein n=1 Tax=Actinophytocola sp. TaxID=1872138 RepID=UPI002DFC15E4|nr:CHRD domain-containing protein [Actinophytocola sp.]